MGLAHVECKKRRQPSKSFCCRVEKEDSCSWPKLYLVWRLCCCDKFNFL